MKAKPWKRKQALQSGLLCALMVLTLGMSALAETPEGISQTTGLPTDKPYRPILVVVSNADAARPPWGLSEADVVYEEIYWGPSHTRYLGLFNDSLPEKVGSLRGGRVFDVEMRQAWDCPIVHAGGQQSPGTDIYELFRVLKVPDSMRVDSIYMRTIIKFIHVDQARVHPHNRTIDLKAWAAECWPTQEDGAPYVPHDSGLHFSDTPTQGEAHEETIALSYGDDYQPSFQYDAEKQLYTRHYNQSTMIDFDTDALYVYSNVIVQSNPLWFFEENMARAVVETTGTGPITAYIAGQRVEGTWVRKEFDDPITYLDSDGNPLLLARGKTFVQIVPPEMYASFDGNDVYTYDVQ